MLTDDVKQLAEALGPFICRCSPGRCDLLTNDLSLCQHLIRLLAEGRPVSSDALAAVAGRTPVQVKAAVQRSKNVELDEAGDIIGAGLSLRPTAHRIELDGQVLYTWCALDALMDPPLLARAARVESLCHSTGTLIRVNVTSEGVDNVDPPEAVVSIVTTKPAEPVRPAFCDQVHFFSSPQVAERWRAHWRNSIRNRTRRQKTCMRPKRRATLIDFNGICSSEIV